MRISDWSSDVCSSDLLAQWSSLLRLLGVTLESGVGRAQAWATLDGHRIAGVTVDASLDGVVLRGAPTNPAAQAPRARFERSEEHTSELQSLMRISYAVFCLKTKQLIRIHNYQMKNHKLHTQ